MDIFMQHDVQELSRVVRMSGFLANDSLPSSFQLLDNLESKMKGTLVEVGRVRVPLVCNEFTSIAIGNHFKFV